MHEHHQGHSRKGENVWNFVFSVFFIIVLVGALWYMQSVRGFFLGSVPPFDALLLAFAAFRVTRLVVYDKIGRWFRDIFEGSSNGFMHTVSDLLTCPWCIGFWSALILVVAYFTQPWAWTVIFFLAIAGAGSMLQLYANSIGWLAESRKLKVKGIEKEFNVEVDRTSLGS